jgi:hypothetical protein
MRLCVFVDPVVPVDDLCMGNLLGNAFGFFAVLVRLHAWVPYCPGPAAPVGDFCTDSPLEGTSILRTYCA